MTRVSIMRSIKQGEKMTRYVLRTKRPESLGECWAPVGELLGYESIEAAANVADRHENQTGHSVAIDAVDEAGNILCIRGPLSSQSDTATEVSR